MISRFLKHSRPVPASEIPYTTEDYDSWDEVDELIKHAFGALPETPVDDNFEEDNYT